MADSIWQQRRHEELIKAEMARIGCAAADPKNLVGLAFSGGGIRSASFALGVAQALEKNGLLERLHYLSTVSGGGYTGSAITWLRHTHSKQAEADVRAAAQRDNPPDGSRESTAFAGLLERFADYLRSRGNYLDPTQRLNVLSLLGIVLRTMLVNATVYLGAVVVVLALARWVVGALFGDAGLLFDALLVLAVGVAVVLVLAAWYFALGTGRIGTGGGSAETARYRLRTWFQMWFGRLLGLVGGLTLVGVLPWAEAAAAKWLEPGLVGAVGSAIGAIQAFAQFRNAQAGKVGEKMTSGLTLWLSAGAGLYGLLLLADWLAQMLLRAGDTGMVVWGALAVLVGVLAVRANINMVTPHRMYRDRLMEAFMPSPEDMTGKRSRLAEAANQAPLSTMCANKPPLHLVNTNLILVDSADTLYRGRGGDNFVLSPALCGGDATGWATAADFAGSGPEGLTLATAMAVSGAAVNAHCGGAGQGPMRNALVSMLMTLFGLQLGYWVSRRGCTAATPNFVLAAKTSLVGRGFDERADFLQLSDGGHFENLALYELVRRRVRTMVVVDGGADPDFQFADLGNALERVFADFGASITFSGDGLDEVVPIKGNTYPATLGLARKGWVQGSVTYADGFRCDLYYVKATLRPDLPESIYAYKAANSEFPHQSTADQFFDEAQLEAYRRLGFELAGDLSGQLAAIL